MRRITALAVALLIAFCALSEAQFIYNQAEQDYTIAVGTSVAVMVGGWFPGRNYYAVGNYSGSYIVVHATWAITQERLWATTSATPVSMGIPLAPYNAANGDLNKWVDQYNIYQSSWWVILSSYCAPADATAITANVVYRQRRAQ